MRKFLIYTKEKDKIIILGLVESQTYPSDLANNKEYAKNKFGCEYLEICEITEKCHVEIRLRN